MITIPIKPLSVNEAWQGRRFKTNAYTNYQYDVLKILPKLVVPEGPLHASLEFGFSNTQSDADNPVKLFVDILQKKYGFNDSMIYKYTIVKRIVKRGKEFVRFSLEPYEVNHDTQAGAE